MSKCLGGGNALACPQSSTCVSCSSDVGGRGGEGTSSRSTKVPFQEKVERSPELLKNHRAQSVGLGDAARAIQETTWS